jgi:hypothetical protein
LDQGVVAAGTAGICAGAGRNGDAASEPVEGELVVPLWHRHGEAVEITDFTTLPGEIEALAGMLPTPLCPVGHLPHKGRDRLE